MRDWTMYLAEHHYCPGLTISKRLSGLCIDYVRIMRMVKDVSELSENEFIPYRWTAYGYRNFENQRIRILTK